MLTALPIPPGKVMAIIMSIAQCTSPAGQFMYGILFREFNLTVYIPILLLSAIMFALTVISQRMLMNEEA